MYEVPFEWVLSKVPRILMMSDYREDLDDFRPIIMQKTLTDWPTLWLEDIAQNQQINGQEMGSRRRFHHLLLGHRLGSSKKS